MCHELAFRRAKQSPSMAGSGTLRSVRFETINWDKRSLTRHFRASDANRTAEAFIVTAWPMTDGNLIGTRLGRR